ncbi:hypothetical protein MHK_006187, partial [Candidatus Magnetomorum sp. HK-1]
TTNEEASITLLAGYDLDADSLTFTTISGAPNGTITFNQINNTLTYTPTVNYSGTETITYSLTDGSNSDSHTITININDINDSPEITSAITDQSINQNTALQSLPITITDIETADCSLSITYASSNTTLVSTENISYTCSSGIFYLSITPTTNQSGNATISITVTDAGNLTASTSFSLTVIAVNTAPTIGSIDNQSTNKNTSISAISLTATDIETTDCNLNITFVSSNTNLISASNISYTCDSDNFTLSLTPTTSQSGLSTITVTINDPEGLTAFTSFDLTVLNQCPVAGSVSKTVNEDASFTMTAGYDPDGDSLTITTLSGPSNGILSFDHANVVITYTPTADY